MKNRILITTTLIFSHMAQAGLSDTAGFSGEISLLTGFGASESHFNTDRFTSVPQERTLPLAPLPLSWVISTN